MIFEQTYIIYIDKTCIRSEHLEIYTILPFVDMHGSILCAQEKALLYFLCKITNAIEVVSDMEFKWKYLTRDEGVLIFEI